MALITLNIAGCIVEGNVLYLSTKEYCTDYLCEGEPDISISITPQDIAYERVKAAREDEMEGLPVRNLSDEQLEITALQRKLTEVLFDYDTLLFHGSVVAVDGEGYLFTAKSGTGKSTHTRLWREHFGDRAVMVNDDKPFLKLEDDRVTAYGSPWNGKHRLGCNMSVPLKAICILERGSENEITSITAKEALPMLLQQSHRPMDHRKLVKYLDMLDRLCERTAFYRLKCNMDPQAAVVAYEAMSGNKKEI